MILSERELDISPEGEGIIVLGDGWKPGEPLASRMPLAHDVLELEVTSNRADLLSMRGVARDVHAIFGIELAPLDDSEPPGARRPPDGRLDHDHDRGRGSLPALHGARLPGRQGRPFAALAQGPPERGGDAPDLERRRHHELRHARPRQPAARLRPRAAARRSPDGAARAAGRDAAHAGRAAARALPGDARDRGRGGAAGHRRHHGRRRLRGARRARRRSCSRRPTSRAPRSCAPRSSSACAPRPRTAGRRASTPTSPRSPRVRPPGCSCSCAART